VGLGGRALALQHATKPLEDDARLFLDKQGMHADRLKLHIGCGSCILPNVCGVFGIPCCTCRKLSASDYI